MLLRPVDFIHFCRADYLCAPHLPQMSKSIWNPSSARTPHLCPRAGVVFVSVFSHTVQLRVSLPSSVQEAAVPVHPVQLCPVLGLVTCTFIVPHRVHVWVTVPSEMQVASLISSFSQLCPRAGSVVSLASVFPQDEHSFHVKPGSVQVGSEDLLTQVWPVGSMY